MNVGRAALKHPSKVVKTGDQVGVVHRGAFQGQGISLGLKQSKPTLDTIDRGIGRLEWWRAEYAT